MFGVSLQLQHRNIAFVGTEEEARHTFRQSSEKRNWRCLVAGCAFEWRTTCASIIGEGTGCPNCKHKTAKLLFAHLQATFTFTVREQKYDWCRHTHALPFDFAAAHDSGTVLVELDGGQHFADIAGWRSEVAVVRQRDAFKAHAALTAGAAASGILGVIRIRQTDVYNDAWPAWKTRLDAAIQSLFDGTATSKTLYLAADPSVYDPHKTELNAALAPGAPAPVYPPHVREEEDPEAEEEVVGRKRKRKAGT